jgi:hypothetical protein
VELGKVIDIVPLSQLAKVPNRPEIVRRSFKSRGAGVSLTTEQFFCDNPIVNESENWELASRAMIIADPSVASRSSSMALRISTIVVLFLSLITPTHFRAHNF